MTEQAKAVVEAYLRLTQQEQLEAYLDIDTLWKTSQQEPEPPTEI